MPHRATPDEHGPFERPLAPGSALVIPVVASIFQDLHVSVAVWTRRTGLPEEWYPIHFIQNVARFELEQSVAPPRYAYNYRMFERVLKTRAPVLGTHAGFKDWFIPVGDTPELRRVLTAGPFAAGTPTSAEILSRWYGITKTRGRPSDPVFAQYVAITLSTLTLEGKLFEAFVRLLNCFAGLVSGEGNPDVLAAEAETMRRKLLEARVTERMWDTARNLLDERRSRTWASQFTETLHYFGLDKEPEHALVGLFLARDESDDPLDHWLHCYAVQRECVGLARKLGAISGQVGDHGVVFLVPGSGPAVRARRGLEDLARRVSTLSRKFGLRLHAGISLARGESPLHDRYRAALSTAERAVTQGAALAYDAGEGRPRELDLRKLRSSLAHGIEAKPELLHARFEQYLQAVLPHTGHHLESLKHELESGLERLIEPLVSVGALDEKSFLEMSRDMRRVATEAGTAPPLVAAYRQLVAEVRRSFERPTVARRDRSLRRATAFIREHLAEKLTLAQVARQAGFAPTYFSKLFKESERVTFQSYVQKLRIERAAELLSGTSLSVERIRHLAGFGTRSYFNRVFKRAHGVAPGDVRSRRRRSVTSRQRPPAKLDE